MLKGCAEVSACLCQFQAPPGPPPPPQQEPKGTRAPPRDPGGGWGEHKGYMCVCVCVCVCVCKMVTE